MESVITFDFSLCADNANEENIRIKMRTLFMMVFYQNIAENTFTPYVALGTDSAPAPVSTRTGTTRIIRA